MSGCRAFDGPYFSGFGLVYQNCPYVESEYPYFEKIRENPDQK